MLMLLFPNEFLEIDDFQYYIRSLSINYDNLEVINILKLAIQPCKWFFIGTISM